MLSYVMMLLHCISGPRLYQSFSLHGRQGGAYTPNPIERYSDGIVRLFNFAWGVTSFFWPVALYFCYRRGILDFENIPEGLRYLRTFGILASSVLVARGVGRSLNSDYTSFIEILHAAQQGDRQARKQLERYDGSFYSWPVDFPTGYQRTASNFVVEFLSGLNKVPKYPPRFITYMIARGIGRPIMYPGSTRLFQSQMVEHFLMGRKMLVEENGGKRFKIATVDNNEIDTMFVDRRNKPNTVHGNTLMVCCDGNAAFYEVGILQIAMQAGYSAIGWNHPGFGGSTGLPFPSQEQKAIDAVMQFAIHLGFEPENIIIYAWSIGAYTASYAAKTWPNVKGVILDATFDDVTHLAISRMPAMLTSLTVSVVQNHLHLNNAELICQYDGPVLLINRFQDILMQGEMMQPSSNRGNFLLLEIMRKRFPNLVVNDTIPMFDQLFATKNATELAGLKSTLEVEDQLCEAMIRSYVEQNSASYPCHIGEDLEFDVKQRLAFYVAQQIMDHYQAGHTAMLPTLFLRQPWSL